MERAGAHMHVASTIIFEGPAPTHEEFRDHIASRLHLVPRFRQKLRFVPFGQGRPVWVDDPHLNLDYHVRQTALPAPGSEEQLRNLAARIFSQQLDRTKPLWEMWLVEGLRDGRFAVIGKSHHALVDGISGVDITTVLFDLDREPVAPPASTPRWLARPEPTDLELLGGALRERLTSPREIVRGFRAALRGPRQVARGIGATGRIIGAGIAAPSTPFNVEIGPHRRFAIAQTDLEGLKRVKDAHGGTVNDVILSIVAGALGNYLRARGHGTEELEMRALVPVSVRADEEHGALGNRIAAMMAPLPVWCEDPVERLRSGYRNDGRPEGLRAGGRRRDPDQDHRLRPADHRRPGRPPAARAALLQPRRHQRARAAVPALRPRQADGVDLPDGAAGPPPSALRRDHVLQRPGQLRPDRRLRCDGRPRQLRPRPRGGGSRRRWRPRRRGRSGALGRKGGAASRPSPPPSAPEAQA